MPEATLDLLQAMVQRVLDNQARHTSRFAEIEARLTGMERTMVSLHRTDADQMEQGVLLQERLDAMGRRIDRIERRLDIADT